MGSSPRRRAGPRLSLLALLFFAALPAAAQDNTWVSLPSLPAPARRAAAAAAIGDLIYVAGGHDGGAAISSMSVFSVSAYSWSVSTAMPGRRYQAAGLGVIDGKLYHPGGWTTSPALPNDNLWEFDPALSTWTSKAAMLNISACGTTVAISTKLYTTIGCNGAGGYRDFLHSYDVTLDSWTYLAPSPFAHAEGAAGLIAGKVYVAGGLSSTGAVTVNLDEYDPGGSSWTTRAAMPTARNAAAGAVLGGKLFVLGGQNGATSYATVEAYDPATDSWACYPSLPEARYAPAAAVVGSTLVVVGGQDAGGNQLSSVVALQNPAPLVPSTPTLSGTAFSQTRLDWSWTNPCGEDGFRVVSSTDGDLSGALARDDLDWSETGLSTNTSYSRKVTAFNASGTSTATVVARYTLAAVPAGLSAPSVFTTSAAISWSTNTNPAGTTYELWRDTGVGFALLASTDALAWQDNGLAAASTAYYQVRAVNGDLTATAFTSSIAVVTNAALSLPAAPSGFGGNALSPTSIQWSWTDNAGNEDGYRVLTATGGNLSGDLAPGTADWTQTLLSTNTQYGAHRAQAFNSSGTADSGSASRYTAAAPPIGFNATGAFTSSATFSWGNNTNPGGTFYELHRSTGSGFAFVSSGTLVVASDGGLAAASTYYYQVRALNGNGVATAFTSSVTVVTLPLLGPPAAPSGFVGTAHTHLSVQWGWTDNSGNEDGFRVMTSTGDFSGPLAPDTTYWIQAGLLPNTSSGTYFARAFNSSGTADSGSDSVFTAAALPGIPSGLPVYQTSATVSWTDSGNPAYTAFELWRSTGSGYVLHSSGTFLLSVGETGLSPASTYYYQVRALNQDLVPTAFTATGTVVTLPAQGPPAAPTGFAGAAQGTASILWSWADASGNEDGFRVVTATGGSVSGDLPVGTTTWLQTLLSTNTPYGAYNARAFNSSGTADSGAATVFTLAALPGTLSAPAVFASSATLAWGAGTNPGGTTFELHRSTGAGFALAASTDALTWQDAGLDPASTYYYQVRALNGDAAAAAFGSSIAVVTNPALGLPAAPTGFGGTAQGTSSILWSWTDASGNEDGFRVVTATGGSVSGDLAAGATTWLQGSLSVNTAYGPYNARAFNSSGTADSGAATVYTHAAVPGTPAASAVTQTSATITWTAGANPGGTTYELHRSTGGAFTLLVSTPALSRQETGLTPGATYHYQVRALNGDAIAAAFTSSLTVVTLPPPPLPGMPGTPAGTALGVSSISWTWTAASGADSHQAHRPSDLAVLASTPNAAWIQTGLSPNTAYGLRVAGVNIGGNGPLSFSATVYTYAEAPSGVSASSIAATAALLGWGLNGNPGSTWAEIERSTDNAAFAVVSSAAVTSFVDASLLGCTTYYFRVRNKNASGLYSGYGAAPQFYTLNTTPAAPGGLDAQPAAGSRVALSWTPSPTEGTSYRLYWDAGTGTVSYAAPLAVLTSTETAFTTGVLTSSAAYAFALRARHRCGVEETGGVLALAGAAAAPAAVRAAVKSPDAGKRIRGNRVTLLGELVSGTPAQALQVVFQYKASASGTWLDVPAAGVNHPNPDADFPYFVHFDVSALGAGSYDLRAVAYDLGGTPDPTPSAVTVEVVAANADIDESLDAGGKIKKDQLVNNAVTSTVKGSGVSASDPAVTLVLPPGAVSDSTVTVSVISNPNITTAPPAGFSLAGAAVQIDLSNGQTALGGMARITLTYPDTVQFPHLLQIYSLNEGTGQWERMTGLEVNTTSRTITCLTPHFSIFAAVTGTAFAANLDSVRVYPVPFKPNGPNADEGRPFSSGDPNSGIIFDNLASGATIKVYTLSGRLVAKMSNPTTAGTVRWDAKNEDGRDVASGAYFAVISAPGYKSVVKKLVIIR